MTATNDQVDKNEGGEGQRKEDQAKEKATQNTESFEFNHQFNQVEDEDRVSMYSQDVFKLIVLFLLI